MRLLFAGAALLLLVITGCAGKDKIPGNVLPPAKMQAVLWDMMRADQFLADYVFSRDTSKNKEKESITLYTRIFTIHQVTRQQFSESFAYYRTHPGQLQPLMDSISKLNQGAPTHPVMAPVQPDVTDTMQLADTLKKTDTIKAADTVKQQLPPPVPRPVKENTRPFFRQNKKPVAPVQGN
jgi:Domain of unknown function (DUF4296)